MTMHTGLKTDTLPNSFHVFADGQLSVSVDRCGGIDGINLLDVLEFGGKLYPDRKATPVFTKNNTHLERPMYGPAIRCITRTVDGTCLLQTLQNLTLYPFGFTCDTAKLLLHDNTITLVLERPADAEQLLVVISKLHLGHGAYHSLKNQMVDADCSWNIRRLPHELRGEDFNPELPFKDNGMFLSWSPVEFDPAANALIFSGIQQFHDLTKPVHMAISADIPLRCEETPSQWTLIADWRECRRIAVTVALGSDRRAAVEKAVPTPDRSWAAQLEKFNRTVTASPEIGIDGLPYSDEFSSTYHAWQNGMVFAETARESCIRAAANKYGFYMMWDHIYPIRDFIVNNQLDTAEKLLRYTFDYPHIKTCVWSTTQIIMTMNEYLASRDDREFLREAWPYFIDYFEFAVKFMDAETGFVRTTLGMGVDNPAELGLHGLYYASCINAWWYGACRSLVNMALMLDDRIIAAQAHAVCERVEANYLKYFYDSEAGYLYSAIGPDKKKSDAKIFQNTNTIGLDYPYGMYLLKDVIRPLAAFQATRLYHPMGHVSVPWNSPVCCEMWKYVHMNQHLGHECKLARLSGDTAEAYRIMTPYLDMFHRYKTAIETFNLGSMPADELQRADWQTFSATGAAHAIHQGICGIFRHRGGLAYLPSNDSHEITLRNFHGRDIRISGAGLYAGNFLVGNEELQGTMQIPAEFTAPEWRIVRSEKPFDRPTLLFAVDAAVCNVTSHAGYLSFQIRNEVHSAVKIFSPVRPEVFVNEVTVDFEWLLDESVLWLNRRFQPGDTVRVGYAQALNI